MTKNFLKMNIYIYTNNYLSFGLFLKSKTSDTKDNEFFIILAEVLLTSDASLQGDVINKISVGGLKIQHCQILNLSVTHWNW